MSYILIKLIKNEKKVTMEGGRKGSKRRMLFFKHVPGTRQYAGLFTCIDFCNAHDKQDRFSSLSVCIKMN